MLPSGSSDKNQKLMHKKKESTNVNTVVSKMYSIDSDKYIGNWPTFFGAKMSYFVKNLLVNQQSIKDNFALKKKKCNIIRPLLSVKRFETGKLCTFWQLPVYPDLSNQKVKLLRNRVRKQLLPTLKVFFNPQVESVLLQFAEIVEAEDHYMNQLTNQLAKKVLATVGMISTDFATQSQWLTPKVDCKSMFTPKGSSQVGLEQTSDWNQKLLETSFFTPVSTEGIYVTDPSVFTSVYRENTDEANLLQYYQRDFSWQKLPTLLRKFSCLPCKPDQQNCCTNFFVNNVDTKDSYGVDKKANHCMEGIYELGLLTLTDGRVKKVRAANYQLLKPKGVSSNRRLLNTIDLFIEGSHYGFKRSLHSNLWLLDIESVYEVDNVAVFHRKKEKNYLNSSSKLTSLSTGVNTDTLSSKKPLVSNNALKPKILLKRSQARHNKGIYQVDRKTNFTFTASQIESVARLQEKSAQSWFIAKKTFHNSFHPKGVYEVDSLTLPPKGGKKRVESSSSNNQRLLDAKGIFDKDNKVLILAPLHTKCNVSLQFLKNWHYWQRSFFTNVKTNLFFSKRALLPIGVNPGAASIKSTQIRRIYEILLKKVDTKGVYELKLSTLTFVGGKKVSAANYEVDTIDLLTPYPPEGGKEGIKEVRPERSSGSNRRLLKKGSLQHGLERNSYVNSLPLSLTSYGSQSKVSNNQKLLNLAANREFIDVNTDAFSAKTPLLPNNLVHPKQLAKKVFPNVDLLPIVNFFTRFSTPKRTTYWIWNRKLTTLNCWNNSLKTGIECTLLTTPTFPIFQNVFSSQLYSANSYAVYKKNSTIFKENALEFLDSLFFVEKNLANRLEISTGLVTKLSKKSTNVNTDLSILKYQVDRKLICHGDTIDLQQVDLSNYRPKLLVKRDRCQVELPNTINFDSKANYKLKNPRGLERRSSSNQRLLDSEDRYQAKTSQSKQVCFEKDKDVMSTDGNINSKTISLSSGTNSDTSFSKRPSKSSVNPLEGSEKTQVSFSKKPSASTDVDTDVLLTTSKNLVQKFLQSPTEFKMPNVWLSGNSYNKKINNLFTDNFFFYFDTLDLEKKEIYWPIVVYFFPKALQRRVVKFFLKTQNWKKIRYSQIENFLTKKNVLF